MASCAITESRKASSVNDATRPEEPNDDQPVDVDLLTFKACVAALWVDGKMMAAERDHLSHLINQIAEDEDDRNELRRVALLQDVNRHEVLAEIDASSLVDEVADEIAISSVSKLRAESIRIQKTFNSFII